MGDRVKGLLYFAFGREDCVIPRGGIVSFTLSAVKHGAMVEVSLVLRRVPLSFDRCLRLLSISLKLKESSCKIWLTSVGVCRSVGVVGVANHGVG